MSRHRFEVRCAWDGGPLREQESASVSIEIFPADVVVQIEAAFHDDPVPPGPPGRRDGLFDFEVVELFLLGVEDHYLELEFGPHGHWLGLLLEGRRRIVDDRVAVEFEAQRTTSAWVGRARLAREVLPDGLVAANCYAIHGVGPARRYLAMHPVPGPEPDFHRLECFGPVGDDGRAD